MFAQPPVFVFGSRAALIGAGGAKLGERSPRASGGSCVGYIGRIRSKRVNCIVDGDAIWTRGEKIRLRGFNGLEMNGSCVRERRMVRQAGDEPQRTLNGHNGCSQATASSSAARI